MRKRLPRDELYDIMTITKEDLDSDEIKEVIMAKKRKETVLNHEFKIWEGNDGRWKTYYQEPGGKRKLIAFTDKNNLIDRLMELKYETNKNPTLGCLFEEWLAEKLEFREITPQTASRYKQDFQRFFIKYDWDKKRIRTIDITELSKYVKTTIVKENVTKKTFGNFRIILRGIFLQAKKNEFVDFNIRTLIEDLFISKKSFATIKRDPKNEIFNDEEVEKMIDYLSNHKDIMNMAILLDFYTGLRIGELCALKKSDFIDDEYLHIQRTEISIHGRCNEDENLSSTDVQENTKTENGDRMVFLSEEALEVVHWLLEYKDNDTEWMFVSKNKNRIVRATLHRRLTHVCKAINIPHKSMHKIRKTYASRLLDSGVNENIICKQLGHSNIDVTKNYYYFMHQMKEEQKQQLSQAMKDYNKNSNQNVMDAKPRLRLVSTDFRHFVDTM